MKTQLPVKPGPLALIFGTSSAFMFFAAIWGGDPRWAASGAVLAVPAVIAGLLWLATL